MKTLTLIKQIFFFTLLINSVFACSQTPQVKGSVASENTDKTLSPYFYIGGDTDGTEQLPLKSTSSQVNIAGIIADVKIIQEYKNEGKKAIEAIYIFPASTRAAVYSMKMTIGERTINAIIKEKGQARIEYEQAKQEGKSASLLEQQRPNVFQMNVANILPGDIIKVEMNYTELLIPEDGIYEFIYPTVVGPRYSNKTAEQAGKDENWIANPYSKEGVKPTYTFDIKLTINAGMPISEIRCSSHETNINYTGDKTASIELKNPNGQEGNKDFILQYKLSGNAIESGLLLFKGKEENFFLAMIQPPKRILANQIPPREYVFIVDVSGSMFGFPLNVSKKLIKNLLSNLKPTDKFNILLFAGGSELYSEQSVDANAENIQKAISFIDNQQGGGGTELLPALQRALALKGTENYSRSFVIATDGYVSIEKESFDLIRTNLGNANFFSFGIGSSVNRFLIEGIANAGAGEPFIIINENEADAQAEKFRKYIQTPALTKIKVSYNGFDVYEVEPLSVPDVLAERPVIIYGKWRGNPTGRIEITGHSGEGKYTESLSVADAIPSDKNSAIRYLWARQRIKMLDDYGKIDNSESNKEVITGLGLKYNLLTNYTSFIAVDSEVRNTSGNSTTVKQVLPLPEGVSNYAVGYSASSPVKSMEARSSYNKNISSVSKDDSPELEELSIAPKTEKRKETIYTSFNVSTQPQFNGGQAALDKFILANLIYPERIKKQGIKGKVMIEFVVNEDGTISDVKVIRSLHNELDKEALKVINLTTKKWIAGKVSGQSVKVKMVLAVEFK